MLLSKSDYILFLRHPAWLWLKKNDPSKLTPATATDQQRMNTGYEFEKYAEQLFSAAIKIGFADIDEYNTMLSRTSAAWLGGAKCVIQGKYQFGEITCITDILEDDGYGYILTEIKSSSSAKPEHELDLAFQKLVLEGAGYKVHKCRVAHVNSCYIREGVIEAKKLVTFTDVTENVEKLLEKTKSDIDDAIAVVKAENIPDIDPSITATNAFKEWLDIRKALEPPLETDSIYHLPKIGKGVAKKLTKNNIFRIGDIKDASLLSHGTAKYWKARDLGDRNIDKFHVRNFLNMITYPIYYLDYEASSNALPLWNRTSPYQQVPFQYSLHIKRNPNAALEHCDYLHKATDNPMDGLLGKLSQDIAEYGSVIVWNKSFEMDRNIEMAKYAPKYADFLSNINSRVIDLIDPFKDNMITDPAFKGSNSIKDVLPVMVPGYSYIDLEIKDGGTAASDWKAVTLQDGPNKEKVYRDLIKYCERDTEAMVKIHEVIKEEIDQNV